MKKILFISSLYSPNIGGGAEIIMQEQVEGLSKLGYECIVLTTKDKEPDQSITHDFVNGIKVYRAPIANVYWHYKQENANKLDKLKWHFNDRYNSQMKKYVSEIIIKESPNIVICHNITAWSISIWDEIKKYNLPIVQVLHDMYMLCTKSTMFNGETSCSKQCTLCKLFRTKHIVTSSQVDVVVGVSQFIINRIVKEYKYFPSSICKVIYNQREIPINNKENIITNNKSLILGYIGTLSKSKGVEYMIQEFMSIQDENIKLKIAGTGSIHYTNFLKDLAKDDNRIEFIGYTKPYDFFSRIKINIVPSIWNDTFPGVAIESCAYGIPVIASNMGGLPEIIQHNMNGLVISTEKEQLQNAIRHYTENPQVLIEHKEQSRQSVEKFLNFNEMVNEYDDLIKSMI